MPNTPGTGNQAHGHLRGSQATPGSQTLRKRGSAPYTTCSPGAEGDTDRQLNIIEAEVIGRLFPMAYPECAAGNHPRCVVESQRYETVPPAAQLAYALTCAAWNLNPAIVPKDQDAKIYEGTDGEGNCWSVGFIGKNKHRRCAFEFYAPLSTLSCRNKSDLIGLWDSVVRTVGETLPETEIKVRYNVDLGEPDLEDLAQTYPRPGRPGPHRTKKTGSPWKPGAKEAISKQRSTGPSAA